MRNRKLDFFIVAVVLVGIWIARSVDGDADDETVASQIAALQSQQVEARTQVVAAITVRHQSGLVDITELFTARGELIGAKLAVASAKEEKIALLTESRDLARSREDLAEKRLNDARGARSNTCEPKPLGLAGRLLC